MSAPDFSSRQYEASHGRAPRGRGGWGFFFDYARDASAAWWAPVGASYSEAKRAAVAEARRRGAYHVEVAP
jgi:hypothetical protein